MPTTFGWEPYGSAMVMKLKARLDERGQIVDWQHETWSHPHSTRPLSRPDGSFVLGGWHLADPVPATPPVNSPQPSGAADRNAVPLYDFPRQQVLLHYLPDMPIRTSALRTLGAYSNVFALESFIDEAALAADADPVEFRLRHMKNARARAVIELAAQKAGWKSNAKGDGTRGRGIAFAQYKNLAAYCAVVAEVTVDRRSGAVRVTRAVAAVDAGLIINPDGVINQIEGGIIQSASQLDAKGTGQFRSSAHYHAFMGRLSDIDLFRSAGSGGSPNQYAQRAIARYRRRLAGPSRCRHRQCHCQRHGQALA